MIYINVMPNLFVKKVWLIFAVAVGIVAIFYVGDFFKKDFVCFGENCFEVEIVDERIDMQRGLMYREDLDLGKGMLFVFDKSAKQKIWMKNMEFDLDIIWFDSDLRVVDVRENAECCLEDCEIMMPCENARYVLEVNSGSVEKIGLEVGDVVEIQ